eukprot:GHVL01002737.1.p1 GENE.GHVL01002737.1~~GHVL01002737.1.p1  ORF type:complete len:224 (+),score=42.66 GHVL01002737.1:33-674(+)
MTNRVYVNNLSWDVKSPDLVEYMSKAGSVVTAEVFEDTNGRSRGCAIVEFETQEGANTAINTLNESEMCNRVMYVREDRENSRGERGERGGRGGFRGGFRGSPRGRGRGRGGGEGGYNSSRFPRPPPNRPEDHGRQVFVGNLAWEVSWQDLKDLFREIGEVIRADVMTQYDGRSKGMGTVLFEDAETAEAAVEKYHDYDFKGRKLVVRPDKFV